MSQSLTLPFWNIPSWLCMFHMIKSLEVPKDTDLYIENI